MRKISVFGLAYVGALTAVCLASRGHEVLGVDVNPGKVEVIESGRARLWEPGLQELVAMGSSQGHLRATTQTALAYPRTWKPPSSREK
jgi:GDP-mannose 6-dehydrogenase